MSQNPISIIILAAGKGTRMKSDSPKVMHKVAGREMLSMVIDEAKKLSPQNVVIVCSEELENFQEEISKTHNEIEINFALQKERKGTAHAVQTGVDFLKKSGKKIGEKVLILYGDTPLISHQTLEKISEKLEKFSLCVLGFDCSKENHYGRLVVDVNDHLGKIVEFKDASKNEREISLCNSGVMAVAGLHVSELLSQVKNHNAASEFYLTDIVAIAGEMGLKRTFLKTDEEEVLGVNSREELAQIEAIKQNQIRKKMMAGGVTLLDPSTVHFAFDTKISHDVVVHPHVVFGPKVVIEKNVEVKSFSHIEGAEIASGAVIGPFARIRPETKIGENVRIGNFVEVKKSNIKRDAKVNHLSYIGDAEIGAESNIGAGVITCNYDGYNKFKTEIGEKVFVGSNCALVAPVKISDGALIAAGSVITKNVDKDELAVARAKQANLPEGAKKFHDKKKS